MTPIADQVERDLEKLDDSVRSVFQGLYYMIQAQGEAIAEIRQTQKEQQKLIRQVCEDLTKLMARLERFDEVEKETRSNAEELSRIRGIVWTVAVLMPPVSAIIGAVIAVVGQKLIG